MKRRSFLQLLGLAPAAAAMPAMAEKFPKELLKEPVVAKAAKVLKRYEYCDIAVTCSVTESFLFRPLEKREIYEDRDDREDDD